MLVLTRKLLLQAKNYLLDGLAKILYIHGFQKMSRTDFDGPATFFLHHHEVDL